MTEYNLAQQHSSYGNQGMPWFDSSSQQYSDDQNRYQQFAAQRNHGNTSFEDEPPLLEELGIDLGAIFRRSKAVFFVNLTQKQLVELDLIGPLGFLLLLGAVHLLTAKVLFGVLMGWSCVLTTCVWAVVASLLGPLGTEQGQGGSPLQLYWCCCLLGYCLIPQVVAAATSLLFPRGPTVWWISAAAAVWSTTVASKLFVIHLPSLKSRRWCVAYPCMLFYSAFALLNAY